MTLLDGVPDDPEHPLLRRAGWLVAATTAAAVVTSLANGFAYDDVPIIVEDPRVHALGGLATVLERSYWADAGSGFLWRPLAVAGYTVQWVIGNGAPWVFHLGNLLLAMLVAVLVHQLYRRLLSPLRALGAALLFAALPVHTEVTANVVGQAELWCTLFAVIAALAWLDDRRADGARRLVLGLALVAAIAAKEQGLVLPAVLLALEWVRPTGPRPWPAVRRDLLFSSSIAIAVLLARTLALGGLGSGDPVPAMADIGLVRRTFVMVALVPRIVGTLIWPVRLVADYNPGDVAYPLGLSADVGGGLVVLGLVLLLCGTGREYRRTLGLLLAAAVAFAPVSNVLFASGVVFAERHLFLPSVALVAIPFVRWPSLPPRAVLATEAALAVAVVLGLLRSSERNADWMDTPTLVESIVRDAPTNYRGLTLWATEQVHAGRPDSAEALLRVALGQFSADAKVHEELGQLVRQRAGCHEAIGFFQRALALQPDRETARARAAACTQDLPQELPRTDITIVRPTLPGDTATRADSTAPSVAAPADSSPPAPAPSDSAPRPARPFSGVP